MVMKVKERCPNHWIPNSFIPETILARTQIIYRRSSEISQRTWSITFWRLYIMLWYSNHEIIMAGFPRECSTLRTLNMYDIIQGVYNSVLYLRRCYGTIRHRTISGSEGGSRQTMCHPRQVACHLLVPIPLDKGRLWEWRRRWPRRYRRQWTADAWWGNVYSQVNNIKGIGEFHRQS